METCSPPTHSRVYRKRKRAFIILEFRSGELGINFSSVAVGTAALPCRCLMLLVLVRAVRSDRAFTSTHNKLRLWHGFWVENESTGEAVPLFVVGAATGLHYSPGGQGYVTTSTGTKWISTLSQHHLYSSQIGHRVFSRIPGEKEWRQQNVSIADAPQWLPAVP
eukprot:6490613-Amphidinium_carterae.1